MAFDPNAAAEHDGLYGLPTPVGDARAVVLPVPFDATTSYRDGTREGPAAVLEASYQVDLYDVDFGKPYEHGIAMLPLDSGFARSVGSLNRSARRVAHRARAGNRTALEAVGRCGDRLNALVEERVASLLDQGRFAVLLGGDHSTPFGSIRAHARRHPGLGILQIDAHADFRAAYEGFRWSHASIMHNVATRIGAAGGVASIVQVGIRDLCEDEWEFIRSAPAGHGVAVHTHLDATLQRAKMRGKPWTRIADSLVRDLPRDVYLTFDIDGLDPALCPDTGTPVPGGPSFAEAVELLRAVRRSGRRIVGCDLNEVAPARGRRRSDFGSDWNANVGARMLYKLLGAMLHDGRRLPPSSRKPARAR